MSWFTSSKQKEDQALAKLVSYIQDPDCASELPDFLNKNTALKKQFLSFAKNPMLVGGDTTFIRFQLSFLFTSFATSMNDWIRGHPPDLEDHFRATNSAFFALAFAKENVTALASLAETYLLWEDRIAERYAQKVLEFTPPEATGIMAKVFADPEYLESLRKMGERMKLIIQECADNSNWRDSSDICPGYGLE